MIFIMSVILGGLQGHRTKEAGWDEGLVFGFLKLRGVRAGPALFFGELRIADQAVWPAIDDFDLQLVFARFERVGDVHPARQAPDDAEVFAVEAEIGPAGAPLAIAQRRLGKQMRKQASRFCP